MVEKVRSSFQSVKKKVSDFFSGLSVSNVQGKMRDAGNKIKKNVKQLLSGQLSSSDMSSSIARSFDSIKNRFVLIKESVILSMENVNNWIHGISKHKKA